MEHLFKESILYSDCAPIYNAIANDRDFNGEVSTLLKYEKAGKKPRILELFSGPSYHSYEFYKLGYQFLAIDASQKMKLEAEKVFRRTLTKKEYMVGVLPKCLNLLENEQFDLILVMRFSIGFVEPEYLSKFLRYCLEKACDGGKIYLEIHSGLVVGEQFSTLNIQERKATMESGELVTCSWPFGDIEWVGNLAKMPIKIEVSSKLKKKTYNLTSKEYIYSKQDIEQALKDTSICFEIDIITEGFTNSCLLCVTKG